MTDVLQLSAGTIASMVKARKISAREVASTALIRLAEVNPKINAVVDMRRDDTLAQADRVDQAIARGEDVGPLAGVPVTIKVNVDQAGYATTNGVELQKQLIAKSNSPIVDNFAKAGAVIVGRTNTPAFSYRWFTANRLHGKTRNPHNSLLTPGGSSGGAAAAVSAGIGHIAHGTDIAGSIRYPAYACGVHGLRPSFGRVAAYNMSSAERDIGGQLMAVSGPLARSIADLELALKAMSCSDTRDPWWTPAPLAGGALTKRVALCLDPGKIGTCSSIREKLRASGKCLAAKGWDVEEVDDLPNLREAADLQLRLWLADGYEAKLAAAELEGDQGALVILRGHETMARSMGLSELSNVLTRRITLIRLWQEFMTKYPLILLPISAELPFEDDMDLKGRDSFERVWEAQIPMIGIPYLGLPGLSVFTGIEGGIPTGVQLVAPRFREDICLAAAQDIEAAFGAPQIITPNF